MLTQAQMAELFGHERSVITKHVRNVFREGEQAEESNVQNLHILPPTGRLLRIHKGCISQVRACTPLLDSNASSWSY